MKKSLLALAVLGAFTGVASAQSSVTLFGIVDLNLSLVDNSGPGKRKSMGQDGINSSRLGFRGVEDLGGGLRAGFHLEGALTPDDGTNAGQMWRRRSTVSLLGGFGELRLGRDYTPTFWNTTIFDPFGTNGVGSSINVSRAATGTGGSGGTAAATYVRANNTIGYFLPALGGLYGQFMISPAEGVPGQKYTGGRIGYGAGPVNVALAIGQQEVALSGSPKYKTINLAGSWKIGPATIMGQWNEEKIDSTATNPELKEVRYLLGTSIVFGQGEFRFSYVRSDWKNDNPGIAGNQADDDAQLIALGYVYNLSPRTALYGNYARIANDGAATFSVVGGSTSRQNGIPTPGGSSQGYEIGLRHSF